jgi:hypothetical protein
MEPHRAEPETIAGGGDPDRPTFVASRSLIAATASGLAVCLALSAGLAVHYHQQLTDVRKRLSSLAPAAPSPAVASRGVLTPIAVESPQQPPVPAPSAPALDAPVPPLADTTSSTTTTTIGPPFSSVGYQLSTGELRTTVYLTSAAFRGVGSTEGQLLVSALIRGATAGASYRLVGGSCEDPVTDIVWAQGVADSTGTAYLVGALRTLGTGNQYFLTLDPAPQGLASGLEGIFALGQAVSYVGQVTRDQGVSGGQCAIGPAT